VDIRHVYTAPLTRYESAQIIGFRASELAQGAPAKARAADGSTDPIKTAKAELRAGAIKGLDVVRTLPDGTKVIIDVADLTRVELHTRAW
jgi:DNA-directed RNA polymerase subunit K/omega